MRILIADDNEAVRNRVSAILQPRGDIEVCGEACNGKEAIPLPEIMASAAQYNPRIFELREQGYEIENRTEVIDGLLFAGVPIERVTILLGHQSVRVTERHYNAWVRSRQEQLEADVASAWKLDPILNDKNFRTNQVHLPKEPVN